MKKNTIITIVAILTSSATFFPVTSLAAEKDQEGITQADANFEAGRLVLNRVPDKFDFGTLPISTDTVTKPLPKDEQYSLVVTDTRGRENGYRVTVSVPAMTSLDGEHSLKGNNILLIDPKVTPLGEFEQTSAPTANNKFYADSVDEEGEPLPTEILIAKNDTDEGLLAWQTAWAGNNIRFSVQPGEAQSRLYRTNIMWTLSDAPK